MLTMALRQAANKTVMRYARQGKCGLALRKFQDVRATVGKTGVHSARYTDRAVGTMVQAIHKCVPRRSR